MSDGTYSQDAAAQLALAAVDAAARPEAWQNLCDLVADHLNAAAFMVFAYDTASPAAPIFHASKVAQRPAVASLQSEMQNGGDAEDHAAYSALARMPPRVALQEGELFGLKRGADLPPNSWRDRVLQATDGQARSIMRINDHGPFLDVAVAHERSPFDDAPPEMARLTPLLGSLLARTLESSRVVAALAASHARLMALFDRLDFGAAFCTPDGKVITANAAFREMADDNNGLWQSSGRIGATDPAASAALRRALDAAARPEATSDRLTLTVPRRSGQLPLVLRAAPVRDNDLSKTVAVLLLVIDPEDEARLSVDGLAAFGVLSPAELDVCKYLVQGFETNGIAERRGTEIETARNQIKSATAKLACHSRLDVVRLAMSAKAPIIK